MFNRVNILGWKVINFKIGNFEITVNIAQAYSQKWLEVFIDGEIGNGEELIIEATYNPHVEHGKFNLEAKTRTKIDWSNIDDGT